VSRNHLSTVKLLALRCSHFTAQTLLSFMMLRTSPTSDVIGCCLQMRSGGQRTQNESQSLRRGRIRKSHTVLRVVICRNKFCIVKFWIDICGDDRRVFILRLKVITDLLYEYTWKMDRGIVISFSFSFEYSNCWEDCT
jgi:hypothetical protein